MVAIAAMTASGASASSSANTITVTAQEYSYVVSGTLRPGVATINFHDAGSSWHQITMLRLKPGVTLDQFKAAALNPDPNAAATISADPTSTNYGEPGLVSPGKTVTVVVPNLAPGTYGIACFLSAANGLPHVALGMATMITVTGKNYTTLPATNGTIQLTDKGIVASKTLASTGTHTFKVENNSTLARGFTMGKPNPGVPFDQVTAQIKAAFQNNQSIDNAPGAIVASIDSLSAHQASYVVVNLVKGSYGNLSSGQGSNGGPIAGSVVMDTFTVK